MAAKHKSRRADGHPDTDRSRFRSLRSVTLITTIAAVVAVTAFGVPIFIQSFQQSLYEERAHHMDETSSQIAATIDETLEAQWSELELVSLFVLQHTDMDSIGIAAGLKSMEDQLGLDGLTFLLVDDEGVYLRSDGSEYKAAQPELLGTDTPVRQITIAQANLMDTTERMVFLLKLDEPVILSDGRRVTHAAASRKMSVYSETFRSSAYGGQNAVFILDNRGSKIYQDTELHSFLNSQNVLKALEMAEIKRGDSIAAILENMKAGRGSVTFIEEDGRSYFVTVQSMAYSDWNVLMVVPEEYVSTQTSNFAGTILRMTFLLTAFIFAAILTALLIWIRSRGQARLLEQEQRSNAALAAAAEEATRATRAKSDFLSHMSHDVRTPINGIIGMLGMAEKNIGSTEVVQDCLQKIRTASNHLLNLINDILDISKLESGKVEFQQEPFSLHELLDSCCAIIQGRADSDGLAFLTDFSGITHEFVIGSELHVRQILINILSNAVKYTEQGSVQFTVRELAVSDGSARYQFVVADTGIGMSQEFQKHIFEPFVQEDGGARTTYTGTGLGMAIVKELVDRLDGTIVVESKPEAGSIFTVELTLPLSDTPPALPYDSPNDGVELDLSGMHVLLAEDNDLNAYVLQMYLSEVGVTADVAVDGKEAVERFVASAPGQYNLILMDVLMPEMDGLDAARTIRKSGHPDAQTIPIIAQTANAFAEDIAAAKAAGMDDHIAKPIDEHELLQLMFRYKNMGKEGEL